MLRLAGFYTWALGFLGLLGLLAGLGAIATSAGRQRRAFALGLSAMLAACLIAGIAIVGNLSARRSVDGAVAGGVVSPPQVERIRRLGYEEARSISYVGLGFAFLPLLCGAIGAFVGARRRKEVEAPLGGIHAPPEARVQYDGGARFMAAGLVFGAGAVTYLGTALPLFVPLPGRDWPYDDPKWHVLEVTYDVMQGGKDMDYDCKSLEEALARLQRLRLPQPDASEIPELLTAAGRCLDERIRKIETYPKASSRQSGFEELAKSALVLDKENRNKVREAADRVKPDEPPASAGGSAKGDEHPAAATGRLSPELIARVVRQNFSHMRACYERGLKKNPKLEGKVTVRFVIAGDGTVSVAGSKETDLPDPEVVECVVRATKDLVFPRPEGGPVEVKYPIVFNASR
jgi:hypothetical protein